MNPETPSTDYDTSALGPGKRKRGRPRKYPMLEDQSPTFGEDAQIIRNLNSYAVGNSNLPPGLKVNAHSVGSIQASNNLKIGQTVSGVIEASFDGGYLLAVRAGKSETPMRGVVFKPGRFVPVSAENDVAPDVKTIRRSEIRPPVENLSSLHASGGRSREKNGAAYHPTSFSPSPLMSRGSKLLPSGSPPATYPTPLRGNTVPIALQPISPAIGSIITNQTHTVAVQDGLSAVSRLPPSVPIQDHHSQNGLAMAKERIAEGAPNQSLAWSSQPCTPFENTVTEVIQRRIQLPTQADGNQNESSKTGGGNFSSTPEDDVSDGNEQPLFVEPLQTRQPLLAGHPNIIPQQLDLERTVKMTQLLQENAARNVILQTQTKLE